MHNTGTQDTNSVQTVQTTVGESKNQSPMAGGRNMANLVLTQSITSFIHDFLLLSYTVFMLIYPKTSLTTKVLQFVSHFVTAVRHAMNFLQFYFFNSKFRDEIHFVYAKLRKVGESFCHSRKILNPPIQGSC
jgi:hypothetical protein